MSHEIFPRQLWVKVGGVGLIMGLVGGLLSLLLFPYLRAIPGLSIPRTIERHVLDSEENGVIQLVEKANPAVVSIIIEKEVQAGVPSESFLNDFFRFLPPEFNIPHKDSATAPTSTESKPNLQQVGGGSGFIVSSDGIIVTNRHVVNDDAAIYTAVLSDGTRFPATIIAKDPVMDVALIKIEANNLPTLELGDSDTLKIGQTVLAIGNALAEYGNTLTKGVISGIERRVEAGDGRGTVEVLESAIQTDAAINPGNSGGPLLDLSGKVIGINTAVSEQGQLLGFAIPINSVRKTIEIVEKEGRLVRPWLGVRYIPVTPRLAEANSLPVTYGVLVQHGATAEDLAVIPGSPADKAGIVENDILLEVNGKKIEDKDSLSTFILTYSIGDTITIKMLHRGEEKEVKVKLEEMPDTLTK